MLWSEQHLPPDEGNQPPPPLEQWRARFLALIQQSAEVFWLLTPTGEMHDVSSRWQTFTGQDAREALGRGWLQTVHPADRQQVLETVSQVIISGQAVSFACHLRRSDGTHHRVQVRATPIQVTEGESSEIVMCGNDLPQQTMGEQMNDVQIQLALKASQVGMWDRDLLTSQLVWTDQCRALFGIPPGSPVTFKGFLAALHPDDRERIAEVLDRSVAEHTEFHTEYRAIWPAGSVPWLAGRGRGIYDSQGRPIRIVGATVEVTGLKQTEEALAASEARFRRFVESNIIGITIDDVDGTIHEANDAFLALVGYTRADLEAGRLEWTTLTAPEYWERNARIMKELLATGSFSPIETEYISKEGTRVPALVGGALFRQQGSETLGICFILDLTARKAIEQQKDLFLGMTSHELKTPLTALKGTLQLLQRHAQRLSRTEIFSSPEGQRFVSELSQRLATALRQVDAQTRLINDLLDVSRITSNTLELSMRRGDLGSIVRETVEDLRVTAPERAILLALPASHSAPALVDRDRISQVVTNYVTNALRYAPAHKPITVGMTIEESTVCVWVQDYGPGLSEKAQQDIWQRFHRVKGTPIVQTGSEKGLGLGLYICQTLIAQHGGQVGVQSVSGEGSTFWFRLPLL